MDKRKQVNSLNGLKLIALLAIFCWHSGVPRGSADLGARMCEIFFVIGGFLVGYQHVGENEKYNWKWTIAYFLKKFLRMWPIHLIAFLICLKRTMPTTNAALTAVVNLSLLQAWSNSGEIYFSFNGATWYLSALLFCYLVTGFYLTLVTDRKTGIVWFIVLAFLRISLELLQKKTGNLYFTLDFHVNPFVRSLEFGMGLCIAPLFMEIQKYEKHNSSDKDDKGEKGNNNDKSDSHTTVATILSTILEAIVIVAYIFLIYNRTDIMRGYFVVITCPLVFVIAIGRGQIGRILSWKGLRLLSNVQLEFFIFHQAIVKAFVNDIVPVVPDWRLFVPVLFMGTLTISLLYHEFIDPHVKRWTKTLIDRYVRE